MVCTSCKTSSNCLKPFPCDKLETRSNCAYQGGSGSKGGLVFDICVAFIFLSGLPLLRTVCWRLKKKKITVTIIAGISGFDMEMRRNLGVIQHCTGHY